MKPSSLLVLFSILALTACAKDHGSSSSSGDANASGATGGNGSSQTTTSGGSGANGAAGTGVVKLTLRAKSGASQ